MEGFTVSRCRSCGSTDPHLALALWDAGPGRRPPPRVVLDPPGSVEVFVRRVVPWDGERPMEVK